MKYHVAVKGIIERGGKILIVRRSDRDDHHPGVWETVGGRMDHAIDPKEELIREIYEEVCLTVKVYEPFNTFSFARDTGEFVVGITYLCKYLSGDVCLSDEHTEYQWIKPADFSLLDSTDSLKNEIEKYKKRLEKLIVGPFCE